MFRNLFTLLAAISLFGCVASLVEWITCPAAGHTWHFAIELGSPATQHNLDITLMPRLNFGLHQNKTTRWTMTQISLPAAMPMLICSLLPILWLLRRQPPRPPGFCPNCGYDIRATPDRCPECGSAIHSSSKPA